MTGDIIKLENLKKSFISKGQDSIALDNVSMNVAHGSITGIIGRSGAGKSTLLRCINRLEEVDSGCVKFHEVNMSQCSEETLRDNLKKTGMIFQHFNLLSRRTALENIKLPLEIANIEEKEKRARECLKLVNLESKAHAYPSELSGGQKQRVAIARAIASKTEVLLCDEATSALDPEATADILHLLKDLNAKLGITIILITHEISVIRDICDFLCVMDNGKIIESGPVEELFSKPQKQITKSFVSSIFNSNVPDVIKEQLEKKPSKKSDIVLRLMFAGNSSGKPVMSELIREAKIDVNIVGGYLDHIGHITFGTLVITLKNDKRMIDRARKFLEDREISIEEIGYIPCLN